MFAKHLMGVTRRVANKVYVYGNPGAYVTADPRCAWSTTTAAASSSR
ncbi:hypothetical protein ACLBXJ_15625 [Methylobacterium mesophilicum]